MSRLADLRLIGGGLGEVVSAEALQDIDESLRERDELALADHKPGKDGEYAHRGLRWAEAVACIEVVDPQAPWGARRFRCVWAEGFAADPTFGQSSTDEDDPGYAANPWWEIRWRMESTAPQVVLFGLATDHFRPEQFYPSDWRWRFEQGEGSAEASLRIWKNHLFFEGDAQISFAADAKYVWLVVRVVE